MDEDVLSVPFHSLKEGIGNGQKIEELYHPCEGLVIISNNGTPPDEWRILEIDLVGERGMGFDGSDVRHDSGKGDLKH
jgi:hypothetical protein